MPAQRLLQAKELVRDKGLSRQDLELLEEILHAGAGDLTPLIEAEQPQAPPTDETHLLARLRKDFGLFLAFLNHFSDRRLGETRPAMGMVLQHSLARLGQMAEAAHQDLLYAHQEPQWVLHLLDLIASLRTLSTSVGTEGGAQIRDHWALFLQEHKDFFREFFLQLGQDAESKDLAARLNTQMKALNRVLHSGTGRPLEAIRKLAEILEAALPEATRTRGEPLLLLHHVITSLRMSLLRPLDRGVHWPAVEQVRGSLQWLWNHLGWTLPRVEEQALQGAFPPEVRGLLKQLRKEHPDAFRIVARALASHFALLNLVEHLDLAARTSVQDRYAAVPVYFVVETELGRLAERAYNPKVAEALPRESEEALLLGAFLRQAVLSLLQDQNTIRSLLQQTLANNDADQLAQTLDNLKALLLNHQRQLMGDLVGLFSPELRKRLFPDSPSLTEEGDRLRQRLHRLWEYLDPALGQLQLHLELRDLPRLALSLALAHSQVVAFRRSPEFLLIRSLDRQEFERLSSQLTRVLDAPPDIEEALAEGTELVAELLRFLELFLLRINARVPLIRHDLTIARESARMARNLADLPRGAPERGRMAHKLIQSTKRLGVRDPQTLSLLKRWVRSERGNRETKATLESLESHLQRLSARLETSIS
ncbi:MAG: hypothetical protein HY823_05035 [Acidobacteria bacterium]|nr:hypothetical protein [Acidobacteriota bacterium]